MPSSIGRAASTGVVYDVAVDRRVVKEETAIA